MTEIESKKQRVLILGGSGMLGSMVHRVLADMPGLEVHVTTRDPECEGVGPWRWFDAEDFLDTKTPETLLCSGYSWVVNCIGVTKPMIDEQDRHSIDRAVLINSQFPNQLAGTAERHGFRVLQIATDCVFSGNPERDYDYDEKAPHDAHDVYGKTKSLGEVISPNVMHLRCSIIGPEPRIEKRFLLEWIVAQPQGTEVPGYTNHYWNGLTTQQFSLICAAIIRCPEGLFRPGVHHLHAECPVTKSALLRMIADAFSRNDLQIIPTEAPQAVDRELTCADPQFHYDLWHASDEFEAIPIDAMLRKMAKFEKVSHGR